MKRLVIHIFVLTFCLFCLVPSLLAQHTIKGQLVSARDTSALYGAVIVLRHFPDSTLKGSVADTAGYFDFANVPDGYYRMIIRYSSYVPFVKLFNVQGADVDLGVIPMFPDSSMLKEVLIQTSMIRVVQKNDTIEINAAAFKSHPDATAEDLVAKMPGISVQNGEVKAQGETVQKVLVDGKEYFGDDATSVLKNMPADMVDKVQVFDQKSDQALFSGVDDGNTKKTMNIVTKNQYSNSTFGRIYAGYGTDNRYQAGFAINDFRGQQKITLLGNFNNINQVNFASQDLSGISSGSSRGGPGGMGGGRGGYSRGGGSDNNFLISKQNGITQGNSFGVNYVNKWGTKLQLSAGYLYNNGTNVNSSATDRTYYGSALGNLYRQYSATRTENLGHRANLRLEYSPDSVNSFTFAPRFSYQFTDYGSSAVSANFTAEDSLNSARSSNTSLNTSWNVSGTLNYKHRFRKPGRTLAIELNGNYTDRIGTGALFSRNKWYDVSDSTQLINQNSSLLGNSWSVSPSVAWTEKLGKAGIVSFTYAPSYSWNTSNKQTLNYDSLAADFTVIDTTVSSNFDNYVLAQKAGVNYRLVSKSATISFGLDGVQTQLTGESFYPDSLITNASYLNLLPNASVQWKKGKVHSLRVNYRTSTGIPTVSQLQNVVDNTNPLSLSSGNSGLNQSYSHTLFGRYSHTNPDNAASLFVFLSGTVTTDYMGSSLFIATGDTILPGGAQLRRGAQFTQPVNLDGYYSVTHFGAYSIPLKKLKSNFNVNWSYGLTAAPGLINGIKNIALSHTLGGGIAMTSNISERIDFTLGWSGTYVNAVNSTATAANSSYYYHTPSVKLNLLLGKSFVFNTDFNYSSYRGLGTGFNQDYILWNASVGYKFAPKDQCEFRITAFDILGQNNSLSRTISETYLEDVRTQVLQQYFMLTFTWNLKKFRPLPVTSSEPDQKHRQHT